MTLLEQLIAELRAKRIDSQRFLLACQRLAERGQLTADSEQLIAELFQNGDIPLPVYQQFQELLPPGKNNARDPDATRMSGHPHDPVDQQQPTTDDDATQITGIPAGISDRKPDDSAIDQDATVVQGHTPQPDATEIASNSEGTQIGTGGPTMARSVNEPQTGASGSSMSSGWRHLSEMPDDGLVVGLGDTLKGRFQLVEKLGTGGMGVVYKARDELKVEAQDRNPYIAVKVLNDEFKRHPLALKALQRESRKSQELAHDNIVRVYDFDRDRTIVYMTMEWIDGKPLNEIIRSPSFHGMPYAEARPIIEGMAMGLGRAHRAGIVHSDFKPGNVMLTKDGVPKVFDFGIAQAARTDDKATGETTHFDAATLGAWTPAYASFEIASGQPAQPDDDVYALACVSYELLVGEHPYNKKDGVTAFESQLKPKKIKSLSRRRWRALQRGLSLKRDQRTPTAVEFFRDLDGSAGMRRWILPAGLAVLLIIAALGYGPIMSMLEDNEIDEIAAQLRSRDGELGKQAIANLDRMLNDHEPGSKDYIMLSSVVEQDVVNYHVSLAEQAADPDAGRYDFATASQQLDDAAERYPNSSQVRDQVDRFESQRKKLLSELTGQFNQSLEDDRLIPTEPGDRDNAAAVLDIVRQVDSSHALLSDERLPIALTTIISETLEQGGTEQTEQLLAQGRALYPEHKRLQSLEKEFLAQREAARQQAEAARERAELARRAQQEREQVIGELSAALDAMPPANATPDTRDAWDKRLTKAFAAAALLEDATEQLAQAKDSAAAGYASYATQAQTSGSYEQALADIRKGLSYDAENQQLLELRSTVVTAQDEQRRAEAARIADESERQRLTQEAKNSVIALIDKAELTKAWNTDLNRALERAVSNDSISPDWVEQQRLRVANLYLDDSEKLAESGDFEAAEAAIAQATTFGATQNSVVDASNRVDLAKAAAEARERSIAKQKLQENRDKLAALVAKPEFSASWTQAVNERIEQIEKIAGNNDSGTGKAKQSLATIWSAEGKRLVEQGQYRGALSALDNAQTYRPNDTNLATQRKEILNAQNAFEAEQAELAEAARIEGLKQTLITQAEADQVSKARETLSELKRTLGKNDPFVTGQAQKVLATAYLRLASRLADRGSHQSAAKLIKAGLEIAPNDKRLTEALSRSQLELDIQLISKALADDQNFDLRALQAAQKRIKSTAANRYSELENTWKRDLVRRVNKLAKTKPDVARRARDAGLRLFPGSKELENIRISSIEAAPPEPTPDIKPYEPALKPPVKQPDRPIASGPDNCKPSFAGRGLASRANCRDQISANDSGPKLVVVPAGGGRTAPFAISKYEIAVRDYNTYCKATGKCSARGGSERLPITRISITQAKAYAAWLSGVTGRNYRLPTDAEWHHAAKADGKALEKDFNCLVRQGSSIIKGGAAASVTVGKPNGWGMHNVVGNAQEWTITNGSIKQRGGSFDDRINRCEIDLSKDDSGKADSATGFRIVRSIGK